ncbi:MAG TPA: UDP-N-acetylmuramoyl-tripeptide--D-alanyl-D-alanine ligase [Candidatus Limnocylindrales bacterium]|nr:UDP-N-acetylmuramoyl-tripeptide--D-alanyl-D-alanine ligase [Candidatus Limnocylindrales bacterium]
MSDDPTRGTPADPSVALVADELVRVTGGRLLARSERPVRGAAVDSRLVQPGNLFVALPGERTDGHLHLEDAVARGAAALLVTRQIDDLRPYGDVTVVRVADGLSALGAVAAAWRRRFDPLVVGITGSIAKTSTKEAVATVLGATRRTLKTEGNQNNEIGLPLTLLRLGPEDEAAVLEMGMYVGGEIADLAAMARPSIGVVTAVQAVHLSRIGSLDAIERAKGELLEALPASGTAVLNGDDPIVDRMDRRTAARPLRYGFSEDADIRAVEIESLGTAGMRFTLRTPAGERPVSIPSLGRLSVHNATAGAAVGVAAGMDIDAIATGLEFGWSAPHRVELVRLRGATVIDDSYNASPGSMTAALEVLADLPGRHVAVLGEMLELGEGHENGHRAVGATAAAVAELLIVVGQEAAGIAEGAAEAGLDRSRIHIVPDAEMALDTLEPRLRDGDVVLVKASRGIGLDRLVDGLRLSQGESAR